MSNKNPSPKTRFKGESVDGNTPINVRFPTKIDKILKTLPNRSEKIRQWVIEGLKKEGYLTED